MLRLPIFEGATWLEIGGGTGDSLGYIKNEVPKFKSIEILDLCEELLKVRLPFFSFLLLLLLLLFFFFFFLCFACSSCW